MIKRYLFVVLILSGLFSCRKYDEGPAISFRRDYKKYLGTWHIDKFYVNDIDSTVSFKKEYGDSLYFKYYDKYKGSLYYHEDIIKNNDIYLFKKVNELMYYFNFYYDLCPNHELKIYLKKTGGVLSTTAILGIRNYYGEYVKWKIKRLTKKEMNMEATDTLNVTYRLEMTKVLNNGYILKY